MFTGAVVIRFTCTSILQLIEINQILKRSTLPLCARQFEKERAAATELEKGNIFLLKGTISDREFQTSLFFSNP